MLKKIIVVMLVAALLLGMTACGQKKETGSSAESGTAAAEPAAAEPAAEPAAEDTSEKEAVEEAAAEPSAEAPEEKEAAENAAEAPSAEAPAEEAAAGETAAEEAGAADTAAAETAAEGILLGGWTRAESPVVTDEVNALLEKALEHLVGAEYTPVAYLGSQIVSGKNHALLCRIAPVVPDPVEKYGIVILYENLDGNVEITDVFEFDAETNINGLDGGWEQTESPVMTEEAQAAFDKAMEGFVGTDYVPVAFLSSQLVSGMNYCFLCEATVVYPGAETTYALVYVYQDLEGKAEITDIVNLAGRN